MRLITGASGGIMGREEGHSRVLEAEQANKSRRAFELGGISTHLLPSEKSAGSAATHQAAETDNADSPQRTSPAARRCPSLSRRVSRSQGQPRPPTSSIAPEAPVLAADQIH